MGAGDQEQASHSWKHFQGSAKDSWHPLLATGEMELLLGPRFPKTLSAITQTVGRIVFHLKLLCSHCFSAPTPDQGEIIYIYRLNFQFGAVWLSSDVAEWWVLSLLQQLLDSALVCPRLPLAQDCAFLVYSEMLRKFINFSVISAFLKRLLRSLCAEDEEKKSPLLTLPCFLLLC